MKNDEGKAENKAGKNKGLTEENELVFVDDEREKFC